MKVRHFRWPFAVLLVVSLMGVNFLSTEPFTLGMSASWSGNSYRFEGGTHPLALALAVTIAYLYLLLMAATPSIGTTPLPGALRRFGAFWLDFFFAMSALAPIVGIVPVIVEWRRTGVFAWTFARTTHADSDLALGLLAASLMVPGFLLYFAIPIARRQPSPGACILGFQVVPDESGVFTLRRALARASLGLLADCGFWITFFVGRDRKRGKIWPDRVFNTRAVLLD